MSSAVVRDASEAARGEKEHLLVPGVGVKRPAMREDNRESSPPILVIDLRAVFGRDGAHLADSFGASRDWFRLRLCGKCSTG